MLIVLSRLVDISCSSTKVSLLLLMRSNGQRIEYELHLNIELNKILKLNNIR